MDAPRPAARAIAALVAAAVLAGAAPALAGDPRRAVAVLEFRSDSSALPAVGARFAAVMGSRTSLRVLGGDQARQRYGAGLDADVVKCDGEARCIGAIGQRLGVAEVVLIGVSELGDVILTVQRIESGSGRVDGRLAEALAGDAAPADDELVEYLERVLPPEDFVRFGLIAITVNVGGAEIVVGGHKRGTSPLAAIRVPAPSTYDIAVKKAGFLPFRAEVKVPPDGEMKVNAILQRPGQGGAGPWYARWWVAAVAGVVVAGAVTTGYVLSRDRDAVPAGGHFE